MLGFVAAALTAAPLKAQDGNVLTISSPEELEEIAAGIPEQEWYPEGYYDIRVALAADYVEAERARLANFIELTGQTPAEYFGEEPSDQVNIGDCFVEDIGEGAEGEATYLDFVYIAQDITQFRDTLEQAGFPEEIIGPALLSYERRRLAEAIVRVSGRDPAEVDFATEFGIAHYDSDNYALGELLDALNAARMGEHADLPEVIMADGCGGDTPPVILRTSPGNGQVWIVSAFAFRVCTRRLSDPWDKFACRWNEVETGTESGLGGRYVYEVVWPDGTSRRGTREIRGEHISDEPAIITFRKTGS